MVKNSDLMTFLSYFRQQNGFNEDGFTNLIEDTSEEVALQILARFRKTLTESLDAVRTGMQKNDRDLIWKTCHKVAGSAELLGFRQFAYDSKSLSHSLRASPDLDGHLNDLENYKNDCETLNRDISSHCPNLSNYLE